MDWAAIRTEGLANFTMAIMPPTIQLPALPHAVTLFLERSGDEAATSKDLAEVIETDTGLTFELLKYVNSSFMGLRQQAKTVFQALSLLGRRQSRMLVMATGAQASMRARKSKLINQQAFWNACLQKALFAREIAQMLQTDADVAFSGALLQDYLLPVLTNDLIDTYLEFVQQRETFPETLCEFEHNRFEWDHALAGACLAHRWNLPDELVCCILYHHSGLRILAHPQLGRTAVAAVALSAMLPDQLRQHYHGLELLSKLEHKWPAFHLEALATTVDQQHESMNLGVRNDFPLSRRCKCLAGAAEAYDDGSLETVTAA
ncbi:MAG TPA: HDOD domain-containing protein [Planctomycetaceae bacterium]|jgi:serine/threonine-protein kinase|nr:HDOD domain-containing protein [Planctomycetaceae bacterium]